MGGQEHILHCTGSGEDFLHTRNLWVGAAFHAYTDDVRGELWSALEFFHHSGIWLSRDLLIDREIDLPHFFSALSAEYEEFPGVCSTVIRRPMGVFNDLCNGAVFDDLARKVLGLDDSALSDDCIDGIDCIHLANLVEY